MLLTGGRRQGVSQPWIAFPISDLVSLSYVQSFTYDALRHLALGEFLPLQKLISATLRVQLVFV